MRSDKMRNEKISRLLISMSLPAIISMLVQSLYNVVDSVFVSNIRQTNVSYTGLNLGDDSFTAVSIAYPMTLIVVAVAIGIGVGANAYVSRKLGEGNRAKANQAAKTAVIMAVIAWLVMLVLAFTVSKPFIAAFAKEENNISDVKYVNTQGTIYLAIYMSCSLGSLLEITCNRILQATGNMRVPMISQLIGACTNIVLDATLILGFKMGVLGAIIATIVGQWFAAIFTICMFFVKKQDVSLSLKGYRPRGDYFFSIIKVGAPAFIMNAIGACITIMLNKILKGNGIFVLSAYFKIQSFVFMPTFGLMQGAMPIMSYNYGANLKKRFNSTFKWAFTISLAILTLGMILFLTVPEYIMRIMTSNPSVISDGAYAFRVICIAFMPAAFSVTAINALQAVNRPVSSLLFSLCRQLLFLIPFAILLNNLYGLKGVWFAYPIAEIGAALIFLPVTVYSYKKQFAYKQRQYERGEITLPPTERELAELQLAECRRRNGVYR